MDGILTARRVNSAILLPSYIFCTREFFDSYIKSTQTGLLPDMGRFRPPNRWPTTTSHFLSFVCRSMNTILVFRSLCSKYLNTNEYILSLFIQCHHLGTERPTSNIVVKNLYMQDINSIFLINGSNFFLYKVIT